MPWSGTLMAKSGARGEKWTTVPVCFFLPQDSEEWERNERWSAVVMATGCCRHTGVDWRTGGGGRVILGGEMGVGGSRGNRRLLLWPVCLIPQQHQQQENKKTQTPIPIPRPPTRNIRWILLSGRKADRENNRSPFRSQASGRCLPPLWLGGPYVCSAKPHLKLLADPLPQTHRAKESLHSQKKRLLKERIVLCTVFLCWCEEHLE